MSKYDDLKTSKEFLALMKRFYFPSDKIVEELQVPKMKFLTLEGKGSPESPGFLKAVQCLYGVAFSIKMDLKIGKLKPPGGYFDYKVPPLEGLWWSAGQFDMSNKDAWQWRLMIMLPAFVSQPIFNEAIAQAKAKRPNLPYSKVELEEFEEGDAVQMTHIGPYAKEGHTIDKLVAYAEDHAEKISGRHHEIYISDPRRTKPEKLKTVLRYPVAK